MSEPWGFEVDDLRAGRLNATIAGLLAKVKPEDFMIGPNLDAVELERSDEVFLDRAFGIPSDSAPAEEPEVH